MTVDELLEDIQKKPRAAWEPVAHHVYGDPDAFDDDAFRGPS